MADLTLLRTQLAVCQKTQKPHFWDVMIFNLHKNSHKLYNEMGDPVLSLTKSQQMLK